MIFFQLLSSLTDECARESVNEGLVNVILQYFFSCLLRLSILEKCFPHSSQTSGVVTFSLTCFFLRSEDSWLETVTNSKQPPSLSSCFTNGSTNQSDSSSLLSIKKKKKETFVNFTFWSAENSWRRERNHERRAL